MDAVFTYHVGKPRRSIDLEGVIDAITDQVLADGDVDKALQRAFRFGTEDDIGLLDILDRLREEIDQSKSDNRQSEQDAEVGRSGSSQRAGEGAAAMRDALRQVESLDDLQGIDPDLMDRTLRADELEWVEKWADLTGQLTEAGLVTTVGSRLVLTSKAIRQIGSKLLRHMFIPPSIRGRGTHTLPLVGLHGSISEHISPWEWGNPFDLHVQKSVSNAIRRQVGSSSLRLTLDDFEVFDRESGAAVATVLLTDMSRSMFESGAWDAAKRAAIALNSLVTETRTGDVLYLVGFSGDAKVLEIDELPALTWDQFSHGTNLHAGLQIASRLLDGHRSMNRQVVIITDGEPTAYMDGSRPVFEHPVSSATIDSTMLQAKQMERRNISFTTITVGVDTDDAAFAWQMTKSVNGRLISVPPDSLGGFVVRDVARGANVFIH